MKTIKLKEGSPAHLVNGVHRTPEDPPFAVPESTADDLIKLGHAEVVGGTTLVHKGFVGGKEFADAMVEAVTPARTDDDPTQAARNLGLAAEDHPGLVALAAAGHPHAKPRGRYGPAKPLDNDPTAEESKPVAPGAPPTTDAGGLATPAAPVVNPPPDKPGKDK